MEDAESVPSPPPPFAEAVAASAEADASRIEPLRTFEQELPVLMTLDERRIEGGKLAEIHLHIDRINGEIEAEKVRHKVAVDGLKSDLAEHEQRASGLAKMIRSEMRPRLVQCREEKVFATGMIRVVRLDIVEGDPCEPDRVVSERPMSPAERQADLFPPKPISDMPESFSGLHDDDHDEQPPVEIVAPADLCTICGEEGCKRDKFQLACGDFSHDNAEADCPMGAFCTGLATITEPDKVLPPEAPTNGRGKRRKR